MTNMHWKSAALRKKDAFHRAAKRSAFKVTKPQHLDEIELAPAFKPSPKEPRKLDHATPATLAKSIGLSDYRLTADELKRVLQWFTKRRAKWSTNEHIGFAFAHAKIDA